MLVERPSSAITDFRDTKMRALGIIIAVLGAGLLVALNIMYTRRYGHFVRYLELHHHEHWKAVGSPVQFEDEPQYGSFGYLPYFAGRRYAELGDPTLSMLGDKMRGMRKRMFVSLSVLVIGVGIANGDVGWF
jgi:hypothetical protein